jgi:hypothetical protein
MSKLPSFLDDDSVWAAAHDAQDGPRSVGTSPSGSLVEALAGDLAAAQGKDRSVGGAIADNVANLHSMLMEPAGPDAAALGDIAADDGSAEMKSMDDFVTQMASAPGARPYLTPPSTPMAPELVEHYARVNEARSKLLGKVATPSATRPGYALRGKGGSAQPADTGGMGVREQALKGTIFDPKDAEDFRQMLAGQTGPDIHPAALIKPEDIPYLATQHYASLGLGSTANTAARAIDAGGWKPGTPIAGFGTDLDAVLKSYFSSGGTTDLTNEANRKKLNALTFAFDEARKRAPTSAFGKTAAENRAAAKKKSDEATALRNVLALPVEAMKPSDEAKEARDIADWLIEHQAEVSDPANLKAYSKLPKKEQERVDTALDMSDKRARRNKLDAEIADTVRTEKTRDAAAAKRGQSVEEMDLEQEQAKLDSVLYKTQEQKLRAAALPQELAEEHLARLAHTAQLISEVPKNLAQSTDYAKSWEPDVNWYARYKSGAIPAETPAMVTVYQDRAKKIEDFATQMGTTPAQLSSPTTWVVYATKKAEELKAAATANEVKDIGKETKDKAGATSKPAEPTGKKPSATSQPTSQPAVDPAIVKAVAAKLPKEGFDIIAFKQACVEAGVTDVKQMVALQKALGIRKKKEAAPSEDKK